MNELIMSQEKMINHLNELLRAGTLERIGKLFSTQNQHYYYDAGTGKVIQVDNEIFKILNELFVERIDFPETYSDNVNEFLNLAIKEHLFQAPEVKQLYERGFYEDLPEHVNTKVQQIILEVTGNCNLRCEYCIYNESYSENRNFNNENMSKEIAMTALDYLAEHGSDEVAVAFYGGEPLLRFELIKECITYAQKVLYNKKVTYSFTTNCTLMTKEKAEYFATVDGISIMCSIDGPKKIHDEHRKDVQGKGTFDRAIQGLKNLVEAFGERSMNRIAINGVFCPPYTIEKAQEIYNFFQQLEWLPKDVGIQFEPVREGSLQVDGNAKEKDNVEFVPNPMWVWGKNMYSSEELPNEKSRKNWLFLSEIQNALVTVQKRYIYDIPLPNYPFNACCVPGARRIYINTKGEFFLCERIENSPAIGNIKTGIDINQIKKHYVENYSEKSIDECKKCWAIRMCKICYAECFDKNGVNMQEKCKLCSMMRRSIEENLILYHELLEKSPEKLEILNRLVMA